MALKLVIITALLAVQSVTAIPYVEERGASVCQGGIYGELSPILAQYPVAQAFCTKYAVKCTSAGSVPKKRLATTSKTTTKSTTTKSTTTGNAQASAWSKCQGQPGNVISTMCSCIETPKVVFDHHPTKVWKKLTYRSCAHLHQP